MFPQVVNRARTSRGEGIIVAFNQRSPGIAVITIKRKKIGKEKQRRVRH